LTSGISPKKARDLNRFEEFMFQDDDSEGKVNNPGSNGEGPDVGQAPVAEDEMKIRNGSVSERVRKGFESMASMYIHFASLLFTHKISWTKKMNLAMMLLQPSPRPSPEPLPRWSPDMTSSDDFLRANPPFAKHFSRFTFRELERICDAFSVPKSIVGLKCSAAFALFVFCSRHSYPRKVQDLALLFNKSPTWIDCVCLEAEKTWSEIASGILLKSSERCARYVASHIDEFGNAFAEDLPAPDPFLRIWGAIDGTFFGTCRYCCFRGR